MKWTNNCREKKQKQQQQRKPPGWKNQMRKRLNQLIESGKLKKCNKFYYIKRALTGGRN